MLNLLLVQTSSPGLGNLPFSVCRLPSWRLLFPAATGILKRVNTQIVGERMPSEIVGHWQAYINKSTSDVTQ